MILKFGDYGGKNLEYSSWMNYITFNVQFKKAKPYDIWEQHRPKLRLAESLLH